MDVNTLLVATSSGSSEGDYTLLILYATLALGASFLCSVLEAVLLSTSISHVKVLEQKEVVCSPLDSIQGRTRAPSNCYTYSEYNRSHCGALGVGAEVAAWLRVLNQRPW